MKYSGYVQQTRKIADRWMMLALSAGESSTAGYTQLMPAADPESNLLLFKIELRLSLSFPDSKIIVFIGLRLWHIHCPTS